MRRAASLARIAFVAFQVFALALSFYQAAITIIGRARSQPRHTPMVEGGPRFGLVVCARDEAQVVAGTVASLRAQEYPPHLFEVLVVAHNCNDDTASLAARAGARVIELQTERAGKVQPMMAGLREMGAHCDFIGVFDADSRFPSTLLATVAAASEGESCIQVEVVPRDTGDWLATGYGLGRRARNVFWWRPREALGLGSTVSGTGFFVRPAILEEMLARQFTLTEDLELTARLYAAGHRVAYLSSTYVVIEEPHVFRASLRQRTRWVRGHVGVLRHDWWRVLTRGLRGDLRAFDMALYLVIPTRLLTRSAITISSIASVVRVPGAMPLPLAATSMAAEWGVPAYIGFREKLIPMGPQGLKLAARHGMLSLLWFPIGIWSLLTAGMHVWDTSPRQPVTETGDHAVTSS